MTFSFLKMQACGNDFVVIDHRDGVPEGFVLTTERIARICHRQFGAGCDQLLWLQPPLDSDTRARVMILNADGSEAEMCGNGMRAIGRLLGEGKGAPKSFRVLTASGPVQVDLSGEFPSVAIGTPRVSGLETIQLEGLPVTGGKYPRFSRVDMGNPHAVFFLPRGDALAPNAGFGTLERLDLALWGGSIENHPLFPNRTNVEFVEVESPTRLRVRVWERGTGATLACGSGACAVVAAAEAKGLVSEGASVEVVLPGGSVWVRLGKGWREGAADGVAHLSGPAEVVYSGVWLQED